MIKIKILVHSKTNRVRTQGFENIDGHLFI